MIARLRRKLAWQFTLIVFSLMMVSGAIFLAVDFVSLRSALDGRLESEATRIAAKLVAPGNGRDDAAGERDDAAGERDVLRGGGDSSRLVDAGGQTLVAGELFSRVSVPFSSRRFTTVAIENRYLRIHTLPVEYRGAPAYLQVAGQERLAWHDVPQQAGLFALVCLVVSGLTFVLGLFFARRSLRPAEDTMDRLEQFTHDASHELRTPLTAVRSSLDTALKTGDYEAGIQEARRELDRGTLLVDRLLDLARLDAAALELDQVDMSQVVADAVKRQRDLAAAAGVTVAYESARSVTLQGDEALIAQLVGNLLRNAVKFNHQGGSVRLVLERTGLNISDTGVGMSPAQVARVFERFYQTDASRAVRGFGLGLPIARRIAELHGWSLRITSEVGVGTTAEIGF
jgi:signal transduction histidine kinase